MNKKMRPATYWGFIALITCLIAGTAYYKTSFARQDAKPKDAQADIAQNNSQAPVAMLANTDSNAESTSDKAMYLGLAKVTPDKMRQLFPQVRSKPLLLMFHSKFCYDCKRMRPVIEKTLPKHPGLLYHAYDIIEDKSRFQPVFNAFKPVSVPILVFVSPGGNIRQVLYNYQAPETIEAQITAISKPPAPRPPLAKTSPRI